jgi:hypothetical protein
MKKIRLSNKAVLTLAFLLMLSSCKDKSSLKMHMKRTMATVSSTKIVYNKGKGCDMAFSYLVKDVSLNSSQNDLVYCDCEELKGKKFEVIYDSTKPQNAVLMTKNSYYREYHLYVPDSLTWIEKCGD